MTELKTATVTKADRERLAFEIGKAIRGDDFCPFQNPEAFDFYEEIADAVTTSQAAEIERLRNGLRSIDEFLAKYLAPWGSWKTAWWEGAASDNIPFSDENALRVVGSKALDALNAGEPRADYQSRVNEWMLACFGEEISGDQLERADRFIEEALELAQTMPGFGAERAHVLVDYVFSRPVGQRGQEVGGVSVTLAALCNAVGINITDEAERELARVWTKVDAIRAKQATKPNGSALPVALNAGGGE